MAYEDYSFFKRLEGNARTDFGAAIESAGFNWDVELEPAFDSAGVQCSDDVRLVARSDRPAGSSECPSRILAAVGKRYTPIQNRDGLGIAADIRSEAGERAEYDSFADVGDGRQCFMQIKLPGAIYVRGEYVERRLLVQTSHDGSLSNAVTETPYALACSNQLQMVIRQARNAERADGRKRRATIKHTRSAPERIAIARRILAESGNVFAALETTFNRWARVSPTRAFMSAFTTALYPSPKNPGDNKNAETRAEKRREALYGLFYGGQSASATEARHNTLYGLYNAVAEHIDHHSAVRGADGDSGLAQILRGRSSLLGGGADLRQRASTILQECEQYAAIENPADMLDSIGVGDGASERSLLDGLTIAAPA